MEPLLDRRAVEALIQAAGQKLSGDWLLIGGGAAALWFSATRRTEDIDIIGLNGTVAERLALMDLAVSEGLSVESVNSAADYFVRRIPGWREELELLHAGPSATVYRPSPTLFFLLKIGRLTAKDLADCQELVAFSPRARIDVARVLSALDALPETDDDALTARRLSVLALLAAPGI